ncbi:hypothetical protein P7K49_040888, partial [Saguinus oedipus]
MNPVGHGWRLQLSEPQSTRRCCRGRVEAEGAGLYKASSHQDSKRVVNSGNTVLVDAGRNFFVCYL